MTNMWTKPWKATVFIIREAETGKVWGISPKEEYAVERAKRIARTLEIDMNVEWEDSEGNVVGMTYLRGYAPYFACL